MAEGYIKLARCLLQKPIFQNEKLLKVWIWCLLKASHKEHVELVGLQKITVKPGQFVFGRKVAAKELRLSASTVWRLMLFLQDNQSLDIKTNNKFSLVTVVNWAFYQLQQEKMDNKWTTNGQQMDNKWTTNGQQMDTNNNDKNDKNNIVPYGTIVNQFNSICVSLPKVEKITDSRKRTINARWKQLNENMDNFIDFFHRVEASDFLTGRVKAWSANFDWILKPQNFTKIIEGTYDNKIRPVYKTKTQQSIEDFERMVNADERSNSGTINQNGFSKLPAVW